MNLKKAVYLGLTVVLVGLLMVILHSFLELWYFNAIYDASGIFPLKEYFLPFSSYLPPVVPIFLLIVSIVGGYFLGQWWWRIVYIEKRHWRFRKTRKGR